MIPIPSPEDYNVSLVNGFLPSEPPLERLPDSAYEPWENIVKNLQGLILSKRLRELVEKLPIISTDRLFGEGQWRRAYSVLAFIAHAYIWSGDQPAERVPPSITVPFLATCVHHQLPPVATYAGVVLWNWKPIFGSERVDTLANLDTIETFTGSLDEKWFYLISIAIEARGAPIIPLMLQAIHAAHYGDRVTVTECLKSFAERLDELKTMLSRMYDNCDPHVFYHRVRPFLAGSKNMTDAGLPHGVIFDDGGPINKQRYVQFSGGSNAQSSIIQFFDIVLSVKHRPMGMKAPPTAVDASADAKPTGPPTESFIQDMRKYMPGAHAEFLERVAQVANIRTFVHQHSHDRALAVAYDACIAMLSAFRDIHIQMVSRYIIVQSNTAEMKNKKKAQEHGTAAQPTTAKVNLANRTKSSTDGTGSKASHKGTGGTSLIPFLRQARDETGEPAVADWTHRLLSKSRLPRQDQGLENTQLLGLAAVWHVGDDSVGGLCHY